MLIRFSVENFLSFNERSEFSLIPGRALLKKEHKTTKINGVSALKSSIILGANASGKSNLIKAIAFGRKLIVKGVDNDMLIDYQKFRLNSESPAKNSRIEYEIQAKNKIFAYGFVFNNTEIVEEWLYVLTKTNQKLIFERNIKKKEIFNINPLLQKNLSEEDKQFLKFIAKGTPKNRLFLKELISRNIEQNIKHILDIITVYDWFFNTLKIIFPNTKYNEGVKSELVNNDELQEMFEKLLQYFDTGISGISLEDVDEKSINIPKELLGKIKEDLFNVSTEDVRSILTVHNKTYFLSKKEGDSTSILIQKFMTKHKVFGQDEFEYFDTKDESDGTNRIIDYIPLIIDLLKGNNVFIIDEIERSLHPNITYDIFDMFFKLGKSVDSQLIASTHETALLTQRLFRKDEIWFVVKDDLGSSSLYSLEDYNVRFDKEIRKDYLLGRYKAIPRLGNKSDIPHLDSKSDIDNISN